MSMIMPGAFTIENEITVHGTGLFSGQASAITISPKRTPGIEFVVDGAAIPAHVRHVVLSPMRNSILAKDAADARSPRIATIEHVMAALTGLNIWGATIHVRGPEVPILDGSSIGFVQELLAAGRVDLDDQLEPIVITEPLRVQDAQGASILIEPRSDALAVATFSYQLDYGTDAAIPQGNASWDQDADAFIREIAPARTYCLESEADAMLKAGLFKHLTARDMLVIAERGPRRGQPIENALRFKDEPARHKLLDLIGDLALLGRPFVGVVTANRSGHALSHALCRDVVRIFGAG